MSSACVCHLNEWCFYCEMYSPLEDAHEQLISDIAARRQEIEQLKAVNAALLECVKEIARPSTNHDTTTLKMLSRECLKQIGGIPNDPA